MESYEPEEEDTLSDETKIESTDKWDEEMEDYPFRNVSLPWEVRVDDLVSRLTLEEITLQVWTHTFEHLHSSFSQTHNIGNNTNTDIRGFTMWKQKNLITLLF